jgi:hypothetical protein
MRYPLAGGVVVLALVAALAAPAAAGTITNVSSEADQFLHEGFSGGSAANLGGPPGLSDTVFPPINFVTNITSPLSPDNGRIVETDSAVLSGSMNANGLSVSGDIGTSAHSAAAYLGLPNYIDDSSSFYTLQFNVNGPGAQPFTMSYQFTRTGGATTDTLLAQVSTLPPDSFFNQNPPFQTVYATSVGHGDSASFSGLLPGGGATYYFSVRTSYHVTSGAFENATYAHDAAVSFAVGGAVVPEPSTSAFAVLALGALTTASRRRRARARR